MEDIVYIKHGELAASNEQIVEKTVRILRDLGGEPASPSKIWALLQLKK